MKRCNPQREGVSGNASGFPDQDAGGDPAVLAGVPVRQSCASSTGYKSIQVRLRLAPSHAHRWLALPGNLRTHAANVLFGAWCVGIELPALLEAAGELRLARLALSNALQLARIKGAAIDAKPLTAAADRINKILGGRR